MIVYVESNFVLELTLMQEEHQYCEDLLTLCKDHREQLVIPAYSLAEPYETLIRRDKSRNQLAITVRDELNQLGRSAPYQTETNTFQRVVSLLIQSGTQERQRLSAIHEQLLQIAEIVPLDQNILSLVLYYEKQHGLSPQDAIVYASVVQHLPVHRPAASCFLNRNPKDFNLPDIKNELSGFNCKIIFSFEDGFHYLQSFS